MVGVSIGVAFSRRGSRCLLCVDDRDREDDANAPSEAGERKNVLCRSVKHYALLLLLELTRPCIVLLIVFGLIPPF